jgi:pimeloyl-ACP methyl ester carboxylesterase
MSKSEVPDDLLRSWLEPLARPEIQADVRRYVGDVRRGARDMKAATAALASFEKPVLVVWDREGKMMPNEEGEALARAFPNSRLTWVDGSYTLMPIDQPEPLARELAAFVTQAEKAPA